MIYIHIPFCHRKCTYCAFFSQPIAMDRTTKLGEVARRAGGVCQPAADLTRYVDALCRELEIRRHSMEGPVRTVYFGGGTPSMLPIDLLARIVETLRRCYNLTALEECTLEANPEDLTPQYLAALRKVGLVDRVSIGVQSLHDDELRRLNRRHTAAQAIEAVHNTAAAGFGNVSIDLIYGIPGQTEESWLDTLGQVATLPVKHLSAYALTVEPGTILERQIGQGRVPAVDDEVAVAHYKALLSWTQEQGLEQYEISNFARPGWRSRHNSRYWNRTPYLGAGAAAHSFDGEYRRWNVSDVAQYCTLLETGRVPHDEEQLTLRDAHNEYLMTALRTVEGIDKSFVPPPFYRDMESKIQKFIASGLIEETTTHYRPAPEGLLHADGMAADLFA